MPDLHVEQWPMERLRPYERNPRKNDHAVNRMVDALRQFGFRVPLLAKSDGELIDGHLRYKAALAMGLATVPVIPADDMSEAQIRAFRILINRSATWAEWDEDLLVEEIRSLQLDSFDIQFTGFDVSELEKLLAEPDASRTAKEQEPVEPPIPDSPQSPTARYGDVWLLGDHILACADATDRAGWPLYFQDACKADPASLCFTSPPYSKQRDYSQKITDWDRLMCKSLGELPLLPDGQLLVNLGLVHRDYEVQRYWDNWIDAMRSIGWRLFGWYVWDQGFGLPGDWNGRLAPSHEFVFHLNRKERLPNKIVPCIYAGQVSHRPGGVADFRKPNGEIGTWTHAGKPTQDFRIPDSVLRIGRQRGGIGEGIDHPAVFPVALPDHVIATWTKKGDVVFEPFSGSGSTLIAGHNRGVRVRAIEIAPAYVDVALIRFSQVYPDTPITLQATGENFASVAARRQEEDHV